MPYVPNMTHIDYFQLFGRQTFFSASSREAPNFSMPRPSRENKAMPGQQSSRGMLPAWNYFSLVTSFIVISHNKFWWDPRHADAFCNLQQC